MPRTRRQPGHDGAPLGGVPVGDRHAADLPVRAEARGQGVQRGLDRSGHLRLTVTIRSFHPTQQHAVGQLLAVRERHRVHGAAFGGNAESHHRFSYH
ncbi:hypothetical protein [Nocardia abscessus]|uniref:hypothetical protein n=1 Tax=Nocardia abscessus TaxID=120957 RepID=UPI0024550C7C|nr:hypothetical protein [Nocardia abscessus]